MALNTDPVILAIVAGQDKFDKSMATLQRNMYRDIAKLEKQLNEQLGRAFTTAGNSGEKAMRQAGQAAGNLSFQLNDIGTSLAGGASPFMVMVQQGSQVVQIFQQLKQQGGNAGQALTAALGMVLNPMSLLINALILGVGYAASFFLTMGKGADEAKEKTETLLQVANALRESQGLDPINLDKGAAVTFERTVKAIKGVEAGLTTLKGLMGQISEEGTGPTFGDLSDMEEGAFPGEIKILKTLGGAIDELRAGIKRGNPDFLAFAKTLQSLKVPKDSPGGYNKLIDDMVAAAAAAAVQKEELKTLTEALDKQTLAEARAEEGRSRLAKFRADQAKALAQESADAAKVHEDAMKAIVGAGEKLNDIQKLVGDYARAVTTATTAQEKFNVTWEATRSLGQQLQGTFSGVIGALGTTFNEVGTGLTKTYERSGAAIEKYVEEIVQAESANNRFAKNSRSSATGLGQFISSTWLGLMKKYHAADIVGLSDAEILKLRTNAELSKQVIREYGNENSAALAGANQEITDANLHLLHFLGPGGGLAVLAAARGTAIKDILGSAAINANPEILGGNATRESVLAYAESRTKATHATKEQKSAVDQLIQSMNSEIASQQRQNAINGDTTKTVDDKTFALLKEAALTKLLDAAQKDNTTVTAEQRKQFEALAAQMATVGLNADQLKNTQEQLTKQQEAQKQATNELMSQYESMASGAVSGFINDLRHGVSAGDAFASMLDNVIGQLIEMAVQMLIMKPLFAALKGGAFSPATATAGLWKSGGKVGFTGAPQANVSPAAFVGARSMAGGGRVGDPNVVPILAHRGEIVVPTRALQKANTQTASNGQTNIDARSNVNVKVENGGGTSATTSSSVAFGQLVDRTVQGIIVRESRPGGLLRQRQGAR